MDSTRPPRRPPRAAQCKVDATAARHNLRRCRQKPVHAVEREARFASEHTDIPRFQMERTRWGPSLQAAEAEHCSVAKRYGHHRNGEVLLVSILMQAHPRSSLIPIDEAGVRTRRPDKSGPQIEQPSRNGGPAFACQRVGGVIPVSPGVRNPSQRSEVGHLDAHRLTSGRDRAIERSEGDPPKHRPQQGLLLGVAEPSPVKRKALVAHHSPPSTESGPPRPCDGGPGSHIRSRRRVLALWDAFGSNPQPNRGAQSGAASLAERKHWERSGKRPLHPGSSFSVRR